MKTILFPTDFSSGASNALNYTLPLCNQLKSKLVLFHSFHIPTYTSEVILEGDVEEQLTGMAEDELKKIKDNVLLKYKNLDVEPVVSFGLAVDNIISASSEKQADMIIMGTKGASGLKEVLIGSNAAEVLEKAPCPVLVIPENAQFKKIDKIVFATNFKESDFQSINFLSEIAASFNAKILIVHIIPITPADNYENNLMEWFKEELINRTNIDLKNISFHVLVGGNVDFELEDFIEKNQVDILSLSMRKRTIFSKIFDTSLTKKMAYHLHIPLLAFHASKKSIL